MSDRPPRFPRLAQSFAVLIACCLLIVLLVALWWARWQDSQREEACQRTVAIRDDNRAMWLWLIDRIPDPGPLVAEARVEIDVRLPPLSCVDGRPKPLLPEDG